MKKRTLAGFDQVATEKTEEKDINGDINVSINDIIEKKKKKELVGIYFDSDVANILDKISKGQPRGTKSKIVNEAVKKFIRE